jgi:hypothetical protein
MHIAIIGFGGRSSGVRRDHSVYACLAAKESAATVRFVTVRRWGQS